MDSTVQRQQQVFNRPDVPLTPPALAGVLSLYQSEPYALPFFESNQEHPNKLIFVGGLTDTIGAVPYLPRLASTLDTLNYSLVQPVKGSDLGGYGTSSIEGDAQEIAQLIEHLVSRTDNSATGKVVIMGHSTGSQDVVQFLSRDRKFKDASHGATIRVAGGICQAPVSDREYFESVLANNTLAQRMLKEGERLVEQGNPGALLRWPDAQPQPASVDGRGDGNAATVLNPAFTAYRFLSLNGRGGDDDFFSSDLSDGQILAALEPALSRAPLLMLSGDKEYVLLH